MMFPSNSCNGDDQAFFCRPFFTNNDINNIIPNSKQQQLQQQQQDPLLPLPSPTSLSSFFYFPSPFEEEQVVHDLDLLQNHPEDLVFQSHHHELQASSDKTTVTNKSPTTTTTTTMVDSLSAMMTMTTTTTTMNIQNHMTNNVTELVVQQQIPRKRSSKRDRHSKINTARGPRDRRMRLSLEVARKFFGLQDMLGFDKASKTVEWLLIQAKSQIKNLARDLKQPSSCSAGTKSTTTCSTSECEVVSGLLIDGDDDVGNDNDNRNHRRYGCKSSSSSSLSPKMMKKKKKGSKQLSRKNAFHPVARESRDKARARARERTRLEKLRRLVGGGVVGGCDHESKLYCDHDHEATNINQENPSRLGSSSWSPFEFETGEESGTQSQNMNPTNSLADQDMVDDDSLVIMQAKWSPSSIFNSLQNSNGISQEHQFPDFQFFGKPWDICNTHNLC